MVIIAQIRACLNRKKRKAGQNVTLKAKKLKFFFVKIFKAVMLTRHTAITPNMARGALAL